MTPPMSESRTQRVARFYDELWTRYVPDLAASRRHLSLFFSEDEIRGRTILDAGCGSGIFSLVFAEKKARRVVGIDISEGSLAAARRLTERRRPANLEFQQANMLDLPFPDAGFDVVWSWGAVHHTEDPRRAMCELMRVLRMGGTLLLALYRKTEIAFLHEAVRTCMRAAPQFAWHGIAASLAVPLVPVVAALKRREKLRKGERLSELLLDWCFTPVRHYHDPAEVRRFLESHGFAIEKYVPASGRFDSASNFILKARCTRNV